MIMLLQTLAGAFGGYMLSMLFKLWQSSASATRSRWHFLRPPTNIPGIFHGKNAITVAKMMLYIGLAVFTGITLYTTFSVEMSPEAVMRMSALGMGVAVHSFTCYDAEVSQD